MELLAGGAAIWFIAHPAAISRSRQAAVTPDSVGSDTASDSAAVSSPRGLLRGAPRPKSAHSGRLFRSVEERARAGERISVSVTAYCLQGRTRRDNLVRDGIIAVDRRLFPLGYEVDLYFGRTKYGRFLADDTGGAIKGAIIDVWMADCSAARRFGRRRGYAQLVRRGE